MLFFILFLFKKRLYEYITSFSLHIWVMSHGREFAITSIAIDIYVTYKKYSHKTDIVGHAPLASRRLFNYNNTTTSVFFLTNDIRPDGLRPWGNDAYLQVKRLQKCSHMVSFNITEQKCPYVASSHVWQIQPTWCNITERPSPISVVPRTYVIRLGLAGLSDLTTSCTAVVACT